MGNQELEPGGAVPELENKSSYTILAYFGNTLPEGYKNLVLSRWKRSFRRGNDYIKLAEPAHYHERYSLYLENILQRSMTIVRLAAITEEPDTILGFSISEDKVLHYVHVPRDYRGQGIGMALVPKTIDTISHLTRIGLSIWHSKLPHAKFKPFL